MGYLGGSSRSILLATEIGFRLGRRVQPSINESARAHNATIEAAVLGVLALLLGFTFAMAMSRYESRKQLVIGEANAIGTYLSPRPVPPEPQRTGVAPPVTAVR